MIKAQSRPAQNEHKTRILLHKLAQNDGYILKFLQLGEAVKILETTNRE